MDLADPDRRPAEAHVVRTALRCSVPGHRAAELTSGDDHPFALVGRWAGGGALVGSEPERVAAAGVDPFATMAEQPAVDASTPGAAPDVVACGWFGFLGFGLGATLERLEPAPPRPVTLPAFQLGWYDHLLHMDSRGRWFFEALWTPERADVLDARLDELRSRAGREAGPRPSFTTRPWRATPTPGGHGRAVTACRARVHRGDLFQANIAMRIESRVEGDPAALFGAGVEALAPDRAAFLAGPWGAVASLSPELFLERHDRSVRSAPIKGTAWRPVDPKAARGQMERLSASQKDRAENTMIVDLVRNDLGRVCAPGSIAVPALADPRPHAGVWHLVSEVTGQLADGADDGDLLRATFPPGSVTGAPKIAALDVISELESFGREVYTGAIGFASPFAGLELSVAIRTFEISGDRIWLGVGGGVVADSDPATEAGECLIKATPLLEAIGARLADRHPGLVPGPPPVPGRTGPRPVPRPAVGDGIFETLLVRSGVPVAAEEHLARLAASALELYGHALPADLPERMATTARRIADVARMRVDCIPVEDGLYTRVRTFGLELPRPPVELTRVTVPGGVGPNKWIDRRLIEALGAAVAPTQPLWCDLDGFVLESGRANVFAVDRDGAVVTPPLDGRVLPGVTRATVIARALEAGLAVREEGLGVDDLQGASELFVTGSLGGVEPVVALDGEPTPGLGAVAHLLAGREERRRG